MTEWYEFIAVYIMASQRNGTLYVGVTSDLLPRVQQHREGLIKGFTKKYGCKLLVWYEQHEQMHTALSREKELKLYQRKWKLELIEKTNPQWRDLYETSSVHRRPRFSSPPNPSSWGARSANPGPRGNHSALRSPGSWVLASRAPG
jgi:putative endonuclease